MPLCSIPCIRLLASRLTTAASRAKARSPITPLTAWSRSSTGANAKSTPQARNSVPITKPQAVAALVARMALMRGSARAAPLHICPSTRIAGRWVKPPVLKRCTRPPSWSTITGKSGRVFLISRHKALSCSRSRQLRENRMTPPTRGWRKRAMSTAVRLRPPTSITTGAWRIIRRHSPQHKNSPRNRSRRSR